MAKLSFIRITKKINSYEKKELLKKFNVIGEPDFIVEEQVNNLVNLTIVLHLDSKIPIKLYPTKINGRLYVKNYGIPLEWEKNSEAVSKDIILDIEAYGRKQWFFHIQIPLDILRNNIDSFWIFDFIVIFQHGLSKTFKNVNFKIRESDRKRIVEA